MRPRLTRRSRSKPDTTSHPGTFPPPQPIPPASTQIARSTARSRIDTADPASVRLSPHRCGRSHIGVIGSASVRPGSASAQLVLPWSGCSSR